MLSHVFLSCWHRIFYLTESRQSQVPVAPTMCYNISLPKARIPDRVPCKISKWYIKFESHLLSVFDKECSTIYKISFTQRRDCFHSDNTLHCIKYANGCVMLCFVVILSGRRIDLMYVSIFFRMAPWILDCWEINGVVQKINTKTWKWHFVFVQAIVSISFNKLRFGLLHLYIYMYLCVYIYILTYVEQHFTKHSGIR